MSRAAGRHRRELCRWRREPLGLLVVCPPASSFRRSRFNRVYFKETATPRPSGPCGPGRRRSDGRPRQAAPSRVGALLPVHRHADQLRVSSSRMDARSERMKEREPRASPRILTTTAATTAAVPAARGARAGGGVRAPSAAAAVSTAGEDAAGAEHLHRAVGVVPPAAPPRPSPSSSWRRPSAPAGLDVGVRFHRVEDRERFREVEPPEVGLAQVARHEAVDAAVELLVLLHGGGRRGVVLLEPPLGSGMRTRWRPRPREKSCAAPPGSRMRPARAPSSTRSSSPTSPAATPRRARSARRPTVARCVCVGGLWRRFSLRGACRCAFRRDLRTVRVDAAVAVRPRPSPCMPQLSYRRRPRRRAPRTLGGRRRRRHARRHAKLGGRRRRRVVQLAYAAAAHRARYSVSRSPPLRRPGSRMHSSRNGKSARVEVCADAARGTIVAHASPGRDRKKPRRGAVPPRRRRGAPRIDGGGDSNSRSSAAVGARALDPSSRRPSPACGSAARRHDVRRGSGASARGRRRAALRVGVDRRADEAQRRGGPSPRADGRQRGRRSRRRRRRRRMVWSVAAARAAAAESDAASTAAPVAAAAADNGWQR